MGLEREKEGATFCSGCFSARSDASIACVECGLSFHWKCVGLFEADPSWRCSKCAPPRMTRGERAKLPSLSADPSDKEMSVCEDEKQSSVPRGQIPQQECATGQAFSARQQALLQRQKEFADKMRELDQERRALEEESRVVGGLDFLPRATRSLTGQPNQYADTNTWSALNALTIQDPTPVMGTRPKTNATNTCWMQSDETRPTLHTNQNAENQQFRPYLLPCLAPTRIVETRHDDLQNLNQRMINITSEALRLPRFDGNAEDWPLFITSFERTTRKYAISDDENLIRLNRSLVGKAHELVKGQLYYPEAVRSVIASLKRIFGNPERIIETMIADAQKIPSVTDSMDHLLMLCSRVMALVNMIESTGLHAHMSNPILIKSLESKLPNILLVRWKEASRRFSTKTLSDFSDWLDQEAEIFGEMDQATLRSLSRKKASNERELNVHNQVKPASITPANNCILGCEGAHRLDVCGRFIRMDAVERLDATMRLKLCWRCLQAHLLGKCNSRKKCGVDDCNSNHHRMMHTALLQRYQRQHDQNTIRTVHPETRTVGTLSVGNSSLLFKIIPVILYGPSKTIKTFAFIDEGSTVTMLDEEIAVKLDLEGPICPLNLKWTGSTTKSEIGSRAVSLKISGTRERQTRFALTDVRTVKQLDLPLHTLEFNSRQTPFRHLEGLPIDQMHRVQPKILIGLQHIQLGLPLEVREGEIGEPVAARTRLGWTIFGSNPSNPTSRELEIVYHTTENKDELHEMVKDFFTTENFGVSSAGPPRMSNDDELAAKILKETTSYDGTRYSTGLLWRRDNISLPNSRKMAVNRLESLEKKLEKNPDLKTIVESQLEDYVRKGYARRLTEEEQLETNERTWYLPYFVVFNPKKPGKARIVFDAAATSNGISLNSQLLKGPDMLVPLSDVLQRFRERAYAVTGDVREMYHQVKMNEIDQQSQRFLRRGSTGLVHEYVMNVMTFGASCSPSSAQYVKNLNAQKYRDEYPRAVEAILYHYYVDDYLDSFDTEDEAIAVVKKVVFVQKRAGFEVCKWVSNSNKVLRAVDDQCFEGVKILDEHDSPTKTKVLGMWWDSKDDTFSFKVDREQLPSTTHPPTKRQVLSTIMRLFDPLGLISYFLIRAKILLRDVWKLPIGWDDPISESLNQTWNDWIQSFHTVEQISVERFIGTSDIDRELHVFVDASENAFAAVAYLRGKRRDVFFCRLIASKTRTAPLKPMSIPRLELQGAVLGARLAKVLSSQLTLSIARRFFWTDSMDVLHWLRSESRRYRQFVAFRVGEVLNKTTLDEWRYVPTRQNVADDATKWSKRHDIERWLRGPNFLHSDEQSWPTEPETTHLDKTDEEIVEKSVLMIATQSSLVPEGERFSKWTRLIRATSWAIRFFLYCRQKPVEKTLTFQELVRGEQEVVRQAQTESYSAEIKLLAKDPQQVLQKTSKLYKLSPFLDDKGLLRMRGRITNAEYASYDTKFPIILPRDHRITLLLVDDFHRRLLHANHETVINEIRQRFAISKLRTLVKKVRSNCQLCKIRNAVPKSPEMGDLPAARLAVYSSPFSFVGIDYFGPIEVVVGRRREKRWGVLFTCLTIRAIHLEIAYSLSASSCIMALRNFISRRGTPIEIRTDNGTNFRGSEKILVSNGIIKPENLIDEFPAIKWKFNPPAAPHFGGSWERLVRSVKKTIIALRPARIMTDEVLRSFFCEAEGIVNSRPLTHIPLDMREAEALTPNHLLLGSSGGIKPFSLLDDNETILKNTWRRSQEMAKQFWQRWLKEYLPELCRRTKWHERVEPLKVGDLVIIHENNEPNSWRRGVIEEVIVGRRNDQVRQAVVRTQRGLVTRPAVKIAALSVASPDN